VTPFAVILSAERLAALPAPLRERPEVLALRHAVALAGGDKTAPGRGAYLQALATNLRRQALLEPVLGAVHAAGIRLAPYKGASIVHTHYGDPGARPMIDCDLACAPSDVPRVTELFLQHGFERTLRPTFRRERDAYHDVKLMKDGLLFELHHRLWHELRMGSDLAPLLARARPFAFGSATAWALDDSDHLFVVMAHAATHGFVANALWLADVALLLDRADYARVEQLAAERNARVAIACARDHAALAMPWLELADSPVAPLRRAAVKKLGPWLQRAEAARSPLLSRITRTLMFDRARDFGSWAFEKLVMLKNQQS
jgi:hypothetical protein